MDGLSAAGSVVTLVAFVGQLVQATRGLYKFWSSVRDVPKQLRWLCEDIKIIQGILEHLAQQAIRGIGKGGISLVHQSLQRCAFHIGELETLVAKLQTGSAGGKRKKLWKSIRAVFTSEQMKACRANLEAAKTTLLLVQNSMNQEGISALESSLVQILCKQDNVNDATGSKFEGRHRLMLAKKQDVTDIISSPSTTASEDLPAPLLPSTLEKTLSSLIEKQLQKSFSEFEGGNKRGQALTEGRNGAIKRINVTRNLEPRPGTEVISVRGIQRKKQRRFLLRNSDTPLGCLSCWTAKVADGVFEICVTFIPRQWLSRKALSITGPSNLFSGHSLTNLNLTCRPVVDYRSAIACACRSGDVAMMKSLFQSREASPNAILPDGESLLSVASHAPLTRRFEACKLLLDLGCGEGESGYTGLDALQTSMLISLEAFIYVSDCDIFLNDDLLESDLDVTRLLVETGHFEAIGSLSFIGELFRPCMRYEPRIHLALEYLCKQEYLEFDLEEVFRDICRSTKWVCKHGLPDVEVAPYNLSYVVFAVFTCGFERIEPSEDVGYRLIRDILRAYGYCLFLDLDDQKDLFNSAAITFSLFLKNWSHQLTGSSDRSDRIGALTEESSSDPDFTGVAWLLALKINDILPWNADDMIVTAGRSDHGDERDDQSQISENKIDLEDIEESTANVSDMAVTTPRIPGAWIEPKEIDFDPDFPQDRKFKFKSKPSDFTSMIRGVYWDPDLYLRPEAMNFRREFVRS